MRERKQLLSVKTKKAEFALTICPFWYLKKGVDDDEAIVSDYGRDQRDR